MDFSQTGIFRGFSLHEQISCDWKYRLSKINLAIWPLKKMGQNVCIVNCRSVTHINYYCTSCLYGAGRKWFWCGKIHYIGRWKGGPWKLRLFWATKWQLAKQVPFAEYIICPQPRPSPLKSGMASRARTLVHQKYRLSAHDAMPCTDGHFPISCCFVIGGGGGGGW
jgi:hypothetical protein